MIPRKNLENMCLFKVQLQQRMSRGHLVNYESKCVKCSGYDKFCDDYTPLKAQEDLKRSIEYAN